MSTDSPRIGQEAVKAKGWLVAHKWLLLRRLSQVTILGLFLAGPLFGVWIVKGNLNYSLTLGVVPLADPYILLQSILAALKMPETQALLGALIVLAFYVLVGGRVFCSWACPLNPVTDLAAWLRSRLGFKGSIHISRTARWWMLAMTLVVALASGSLAWELVNPVSMLHRGIIFGMGAAWAVVLAVFLFDLFVARHGWCGHLCPVGAFYSLLGKASVVRVSASARAACNDCMDCFAVCPESLVIKPALKGADKGIGPVILASDCTNCGRCIDVCAKNVFSVSTRFSNTERPAPDSKTTAATQP